MKPDQFKQTFTKLFPSAGEPFTGSLPGTGTLLGDLLEYANLPQILTPLPWQTRFAFCGHQELKIVVKAGADWDEAVLSGLGDGWSVESGMEPAASYWAYLLEEVESLGPKSGRRGFDGLVHFPAEDGATCWPLQSLALVLSALAVRDLSLDADISRRKLLETIEELGVGMPYWSLAHAACALLASPSCLLRAGGRADQIEMLPLPPEWTILALPVRVPPVRRLVQLSECARFLVEQQIRAEFDPEYELDSLADLWFGPLCLRHDEVKDIVNAALSEPKIFRRLLDVLESDALGLQDKGVQPLRLLLDYYVQMYRCVELAGDAVQAGDGEAMRALYTEGLRHRASLLAGLGGSQPVSEGWWQNLPVLGFSLSGCGSQQWLLGLVETEEKDFIKEEITRRVADAGVLVGESHLFQPGGAGGYED